MQVIRRHTDDLRPVRPGFVRSLYLPGRTSGERLDDDRMLNVDLEDMPVPDRSFDLVIPALPSRSRT